MAHSKKNGIYSWRKKKANHGVMGATSLEKSTFNRHGRRKNKIFRVARVIH